MANPAQSILNTISETVNSELDKFDSCREPSTNPPVLCKTNPNKPNSPKTQKSTQPRFSQNLMKITHLAGPAKTNANEPNFNRPNTAHRVQPDRSRSKPEVSFNYSKNGERFPLIFSKIMIVCGYYLGSGSQGEVTLAHSLMVLACIRRICR